MSERASIRVFRALAAIAVATSALAGASTAVATQREQARASPQEPDDAADCQQEADDAADCEKEADDAADCEKEADDGSGDALTVFGSYAWADEINGSLPIDIRSVGVRWSRRWGAGGGGLLRGNPTLSIELIPAMFFNQEPSAWAPALHVIYEHRLAPDADVHPVIRAGAGFLYANRDVPPGETRRNFSLFAGLGLDVDVASDRQIAVEYRLHHVSNADTGPVNPGINAHTLTLGLTFELR